MTQPTKKRSTPYLNNKDLLAETLTSLEKDEMTNKLADMLFKLVTRYSKKGNWASYTYNDDMRGYALMMLMRTWKSFNPEKSDNAFSFFTQCVKNSFIQFLNQERRQRDIRDEMLIKQGLSPSHTYAATFENNQKEGHFVDDEEDFEYIQQQHKDIKNNQNSSQDEKSKDTLLEF